MSQASQHVRYLTRSAVLLALAMSVQMLGLPQLITGSAVNAVLYMTALSAPPGYGVVVGALTPVIALWRGILAPAAAPLVPFIAVGNAILVLVFWLSQRPVAGFVARAGAWALLSVLGVVLASGLKAGFLALAVARIVHVPDKLAAAMQWPQLFTALTGGVIVLILWPAVRSVLKRS
ncbi:MAG: ECF transporter S component [Limnochordales bacterium]|nr:ECF transporter S component [Limnochordales bacterium]